MANYIYIDDVFLEFYNRILLNLSQVNNQDLMAMGSFFNLLGCNEPVTQAQSKYILKLLEKYKTAVISSDFDYRDHLLAPQWKKPFRVIDDSKKIFIEIDNNSKPWICLKHPYSLKEKFNQNVIQNGQRDVGIWDPETRVRKFPPYTINFVLLQKFINDHGFEIDDSFLDYVATVEEIWQESMNFLPYCEIVEDVVVLKNANESTQIYFDKNKNDNLYDNLLLAKSLGFKLENLTKPENLVEKITVTNSTTFWLKDMDRFFQLYKKISGHVCVIVDDSVSVKSWIENFVVSAVKNGVTADEMRVCFRSRNDDDPEFNTWIKNNNLGGPIDNSRLLIFKNKPPKWLFKDNIDVKLIVVNRPFPPSSLITQNWFSNHSCVIYLDELRPSVIKEKNIVNL